MVDSAIPSLEEVLAELDSEQNFDDSEEGQYIERITKEIRSKTRSNAEAESES